MPGIDDWDGGFEGPQDTEIERPPLDEVQAEDAAPRAVRREDTTGSYKTLQGYEVARETLEKMYTAKGKAEGRTLERTYVLSALRFYLIDRGSHSDGADDFIAQFHRWVRDIRNRRMVEHVLGWDKDPP